MKSADIDRTTDTPTVENKKTTAMYQKRNIAMPTRIKRSKPISRDLLESGNW